MPGWVSNGVDPLWADATSPYGPGLPALWPVVLEIAGPSAFSMALMFRFLAVAGVAILAWAVPVLAKAYEGSTWYEACGWACLNPLVFMHFISGAHNVTP